MRPQISVIMLTYNREKYIRQAIESIIAQTYKDFEFIIVDNGSTDSSGDIADKYASIDDRIKVLHKKRGNIGSGRNAGLDTACGDYIAFIDDDDYVEKDFLSFLYNLAIANNADISVCGSYQDLGGIITPNWVLVYEECYVMNAEKAVEMFLRRKLYNAAMPTKLVKRELTDKIRFNNEGAYDDISITYKYIAHAGIIAAHGVPKYTFRRHNGNNSNAATKHDLLNPIQLREYLETYRERTKYISRLFPQLYSLARYRELAYMVSMIEKINRFDLINCKEPLEYMTKEVRNHISEFLESGYCEEFERVWAQKYIGIPEYNFNETFRYKNVNTLQV